MRLLSVQDWKLLTSFMFGVIRRHSFLLLQLTIPAPQLKQWIVIYSREADPVPRLPESEILATNVFWRLQHFPDMTGTEEWTEHSECWVCKHYTTHKFKYTPVVSGNLGFFVSCLFHSVWTCETVKLCGSPRCGLSQTLHPFCISSASNLHTSIPRNRQVNMHKGIASIVIKSAVFTACKLM